MRYWWVNQNQTGPQEWAGGYLWSPKTKKNDARNPYYEFMREVAPEDLILAFADTHIRKIGIAQSHAYECPKPPEFGTAGPNWNNIGWKVDVRWVDLAHPIRPSDHMDRLRGVLPPRYSPLRANGRGLQNIYLTEIPTSLMVALVDLIGHEARVLLHANRQLEATEAEGFGQGFAEWEEHLRREVESDPHIPETEKRQIVLARRGQGAFKRNVRRVEHRCRITGVDRAEHLRASHIKPWRDGSNPERLDGENGLLLTPSIDHLFDRGFISFEDGGRLLVSPVAHPRSLERMGISIDEKVEVGPFSEGQRRFLGYHRDRVFLESRVRRD